MHTFRSSIALCVILLILPTAAAAVDGVLEINQACVVTGCFAGDSPGFPVTIDRNQPGSYQLTSSLVNGDEDADAIQIADDHVTLDLNGFAVNGAASCTGSGATLVCGPLGAGSGIATNPAGGRTGVVVRNGIVRGNPSLGISLGPEAWVHNVHVAANAGKGIDVGNWSLVTECRVERNMGGGISAASASLVDGNTVFGGRDSGIVAKDGALVSSNGVQGNGGTGIDSASSSSGGTLVVDNSVSANGAGASLHAADGFARNVLDDNAMDLSTDQVSGGVQLGTGTNLCAGALCP